jgi:hypothetical protein
MTASLSALQVVERFGVDVTAIASWTSIVAGGATPEERFETARHLKQTLEARFERETWRVVAKPIFDRLRQRQRDSLVAYIMQCSRWRPRSRMWNPCA